MIIQSARLLTTLMLGRLVRHVFSGPANEAIEVLSGSADDLALMQQDAAAAGKRYAIRHFKISPEAPVSQMELNGILRDIAVEFRFDLERCVVVEHKKPKVGGGYGRHWHLLVPEWDPVLRRVLDAHWMRPRQEKLARVAELRLGHPLVTGWWNAAVARSLTAEGNGDGAAAVAALAQKPRPESAYSSRRHQAAKRHGVSLPRARAAVKQAWATAENPSQLMELLAATGMRVRLGDKNGAWIAETVGADPSVPVLVGALHRLVRERKRVIADFMRPLAAPASTTTPVSTDVAPVVCESVPAPPVRAAPHPVSDPPSSKEQANVESNDHAHSLRPRRSGERQPDGGGGKGTSLPHQEGADPGAVRLPSQRGADGPAAGPVERRAGHGGDPGRPDRSPAREAGRGGGAADGQSVRARVLTRAALGVGRPLAAGKATGLDLLLRRMDDVLITAAGRRQQSSAGRIDAVSWANQPRGAPTTHHPRVGISRADSSPDVETRRRRWIAYCLRHAYKVGWVPEVAAANVVQVEWRAAEEALVLTLRSGTQLIDRFDRIEVLGETDDTAITELVAAAKRRGWQAARVFGTWAFRVEAARALLAAGITVEDPPLSSAEIEALRAAANTASRQAHRSDGSDLPGLMPEAAPLIETFPEFTPLPRPPTPSGWGYFRAYGQRLDRQFAGLDRKKIPDALARQKTEKATPGT